MNETHHSAKGFLRRCLSVAISMVITVCFIVPTFPMKIEAYSSVTEGIYYIEHKESGKVVDVTDNSSSNGTQLQIWQKYDDHTNQKFKFEKINGVWKITALSSNKVVEVRNSSKENYTEVAQWTDSGLASQRWNIIENSDGTFSFQNVNSGKFMNVFLNSTDNGAKLIQFDNDGTTACKFNLIKLNNSQIKSACWTRNLTQNDFEWEQWSILAMFGETPYIKYDLGVPKINSPENEWYYKYYPEDGQRVLYKIEYIDRDTARACVVDRAKYAPIKEQIRNYLLGQLKDSAMGNAIDKIAENGTTKGIPLIGDAFSTLMGVCEIIYSADGQASWNTLCDIVIADQAVIKKTYISVTPGTDSAGRSTKTYKAEFEYEVWDGKTVDPKYSEYLSNAGTWKYDMIDYTTEYTIQTLVVHVPANGANHVFTVNNNINSNPSGYITGQTNYQTGLYRVTVKNTSSLNVRAGSSTSYKKIGKLYQNDTVEVTEIKNSCWGKINYNGKTGWICLQYAKYEGQPETIVWSQELAGEYTLTKNSVNLRKGTSTQSEVITKLTSGNIVQVIETATLTDGRLWAHVNYNGTTGYCCMKEGNEYWLTKRIVPGKPSVSVTSGTSFSDTVFTWKNCTNAKSYDIRIYDSSGKVVDSKFGLTATSYQTRLKAGSYQVDVASVYNSDSYTFSDRVSFNIGKVTPEKPVVSVSAGNDLSDTHISWNSCKYADCYDMVIYKSDGKEYKKLTNTTATSFTGNLTDIADYYVIVIAKNNTDGTTAKSDQKNFTVVSAVPSKPTLSVLPGNNYTNTTFSWNPCENADSYILDVVNKDTGKTVISETLTATSYEMVLSTAGNYYAQVTSVYAKGNTKNPSEKITFAVESVDVTAFTVSVSGLSDSVIQLEWTESKHATQYDIYRYEDGAFKLIKSTPERSFTDTGLYIGTEYKYYVKSSNQWTSIDSNQVTGETILLYLNGSGTQDSPYLISSADDLVEFSGLINDPLTNKMFANCYYKQTADIDMTGNTFTPIGIQSASFKGNYNGNYCKINGLQLNTSAAYTGLFGHCGKATISNLVVHGTVSSTKNVVGGIVGEIGYGGKIENCAFYGNVSGADYVGGIVGNIENGGIIIRCYHMGNVTGNKYVGGIAGEARVGKNANSSNIKISSSYHAGGNVSGTSNGGIVGIEDVGTAKQCSVTYIDCFYLKGSASYAANGGTDAGILVATDTVFQNLVETLGAPYTDGGTTNHHYPVFIWESELYEFQGQGTSSSPYLITNAEELRIMSEYVNYKYLNVRYGNAFYMQTANINLANEAFTPIGNESTPFNGAYNGGYYTISGLNSTGKDAGLFGYAITISIKNLIVSGKVSADRNAGGLLGISTEYVELTQCAFDGTVNGSDCGGLIGKVCSTGKIADCYQNGAITGTNAGGLVGSFECEKTASDESLVITASYHGDGSISGGGAIGLINGDSNAVYTENVYYLKNTATKAGNAIVVNESVLKDLAITLEKPYVNHTMNNGYPVFSWQVSRYEFEGNGTVNSPYIIATADDLIALQIYVNDPSFNSVYGSAYYLQVSDIDLGDKEWDAIGINSDCAFNGVYDGNFCTVYGLNAYGDTYSGLFGQVGATSGGRNAGVYNLIIKYGTSCSATGVTGGTAAVLMNGASVDSCSVIGDLSGGTGVGGVVGIVRKSANISNSFHNGNVVGNSKVGGIVGYVESGTARIENCYHTNGVVAADEYCGAIVGFSKGTASISNCYYLNGTADGAVNGTANSGVMSVNATVLQNLSATLGEAYIDNFTLYNSGYPIFAKQFEMDTLGVVGDANADGVFNVADVVMLQKWLLCAGDLTDWSSADLCEDGIIDVFDLVLMKRLLLQQIQ